MMTATPIYDSLDLPVSDVDVVFRWGHPQPDQVFTITNTNVRSVRDHPRPSGHGAGDEATLTQVADAAGEHASTDSPAAPTSTEESAS
jgi:hypothetical protein